jgi:hypothetical protein
LRTIPAGSGLYVLQLLDDPKVDTKCPKAAGAVILEWAAIYLFVLVLITIRQVLPSKHMSCLYFLLGRGFYIDSLSLEGKCMVVRIYIWGVIIISRAQFIFSWMLDSLTTPESQGSAQPSTSGSLVTLSESAVEATSI